MDIFGWTAVTSVGGSLFVYRTVIEFAKQGAGPSVPESQVEGSRHSRADHLAELFTKVMLASIGVAAFSLTQFQSVRLWKLERPSQILIIRDLCWPHFC